MVLGAKWRYTAPMAPGAEVGRERESAPTVSLIFLTRTGRAVVIRVALHCGASRVPTVVEADSIRREACSCSCSCYAECSKVRGCGSGARSLKKDTWN
jgi:hypothetical protein